MRRSDRAEYPDFTTPRMSARDAARITAKLEELRRSTVRRKRQNALLMGVFVCGIMASAIWGGWIVYEMASAVIGG